MAKVYAMIADGTEEVECLAVVDLLRRAGVEVALVSVMPRREIISSHKIKIAADVCVGEVDLTDADLIFLPGGMPGSAHLAGCKPLIDAIGKMLRLNKRVAAICAAPALVLGANGLLRGRRAVCFPGFEDKMTGAELMPFARVVTDGNITTARGLGCALELGLELVKHLVGVETAMDIKEKIQY